MTSSEPVELFFDVSVTSQLTVKAGAIGNKEPVSGSGPRRVSVIQVGLVSVISIRAR